VLRVEFSWYELNKWFPLSLDSNKFLPKSCAVTLTRKQSLAVLASRDHFHYSYTFVFFILQWQGRAGEAWKSFYKMMLLLPSPNKSVSHLSLVFPFCLLSYYFLRISLFMFFTYQSTFGLHSLSKTYATRAAGIYRSNSLRVNDLISVFNRERYSSPIRPDSLSDRPNLPAYTAVVCFSYINEKCRAGLNVCTNLDM
jgi:hypothetical protein